jgi:hypothetical protein
MNRHGWLVTLLLVALCLPACSRGSSTNYKNQDKPKQPPVEKK